MAAEFLLDFEPVVLAQQAGWPRPPGPACEAAPAAPLGPLPTRRPLWAVLRHVFQKLMGLPQLQRDLREVENELRFARNRLLHYQTLGEELLARDAQRVVEGHEQLKATLRARLQPPPPQ